VKKITVSVVKPQTDGRIMCRHWAWHVRGRVLLCSCTGWQSMSHCSSCWRHYDVIVDVIIVNTCLVGLHIQSQLPAGRHRQFHQILRARNFH